MKRVPNIVVACLFALVAAFALTGGKLVGASGSSRFSQIVQPLARKAEYSYTYDPARNAVVLEVLGVAPQDLGALDQYDERLVRKLVVREKAGVGSQAVFFLRDKDVRVTITDHAEPFRLHVDFFDRGFKESKDPVTGLPLSGGLGDDGAAPAAGATAKPATFESAPPPGDKGAAREEPAASESGGATAAKSYSLLQPTPASTPAKAVPAAEAAPVAPEGRGKAWADYPYYVYRLQTGLYKAGKNPEADLAKAAAPTDAAEAAARQAASLYDLGHEARALEAYQKVLHRGSDVFDRDAGHLWRLAEAHLGQGNRGLADGYYQALREKHPDSPLAGFAAMRQLDVKAIAATEKGQTDTLHALLEPLAAIPTERNPELAAQVAIRKAYWAGSAGVEPQEAQARHFIPRVDADAQKELRAFATGGESVRTGFIAQTVALHSALAEGAPWSRPVMEEAGRYLATYQGPATAPFTTKVAQRASAVVTRALAAAQQEQKPMRIIEIYEATPDALRAGVTGSPLAEAVAHAYREMGQSDKALPFFRQAAKQASEGPARFKAQLWLALATTEAQGTGRAGAGRDLAKASGEAATADAAALAAWEAMTPADKDEAYRVLKPVLDAQVMAPALLRAPAAITIERQTASVAPALAGAARPDAAQAAPAPLGDTIRLLARTAVKLDALGDKAGARRARAALLAMGPEGLKGKPDEGKIWVEEASRLAEEYRQANQYYEAGEAYVRIGDAKDGDGRAESLYKGGLLLYRAGRREAALAAFKRASEDGNDRVYAELAQKRLMQLQQ